MIARVFPSKTTATPDDDFAFFGLPPEQPIDVSEVHVSVTFNWDKPAGEFLAGRWAKAGYKTKIGGPAYGDRHADVFIPGMYLKKGYVITSRGCDNNCWFCAVPQGVKELPITDGHNLLDDNLLACSDGHIKAVFEMLGRQKERPVFTGGLEAKGLKEWHVELLAKVKPKAMFFAYDTPDDYEPLFAAGKLLQAHGFTLKKRKAFCYVLCGYPGDTLPEAKKRMIDTLKAGFMPFAMQYRDYDSGFKDPTWGRFQRSWCRPAAIVASNKEFFK